MNKAQRIALILVFYSIVIGITTMTVMLIW